MTAMTLWIDTSSNQEIVVGLTIAKKKHALKRPVDRLKAQAVLPMVDELLMSHNLSLQDITAIEVNTGPGSFTGLRVGIAVANTLGFLLHIPINGLPVGTRAQAVYS